MSYQQSIRLLVEEDAVLFSEEYFLFWVPGHGSQHGGSKKADDYAVHGGLEEESKQGRILIMFS